MSSFNKIVSNLSFNPSLMDQLYFYSRRLKKEESVRKLGVVLIIFSMFIQVFAAMVPPEKSLAASNNDVIRGGVSTIEQLRSKYNAQRDVKALYNRFGLSGGNLTHAGASPRSFNFQQQGDRGTRTVGRINFASTRDRALGPYGGTTFYSRNAGEWRGSTPAYYFGKQRGSDGNYFYVWVLKDCGNIAYRRAPAPARPRPAPAPAPRPAPAPVPRPVAAPVPAPTAPPIPKSTPEIERSKTVQNITQNLSPQQTPASKAQAGDVLEYSLIARSKNNVPQKKYDIDDYIGDILDYSSLDQAFLASQGGTFFAASKTISWKNLSVPIKGELKKSFRVVLLNPLPSTNQPNTTASDFDCQMQNGYGNETKVDVECAVVKEIEQLPNTGPGTTILAAFTITSISGYFLARTRLLARELGIIKRDTGGHGDE